MTDFVWGLSEHLLLSRLSGVTCYCVCEGLNMLPCFERTGNSGGGAGTHSIGDIMNLERLQLSGPGVRPTNTQVNPFTLKHKYTGGSHKGLNKACVLCEPTRPVKDKPVRGFSVLTASVMSIVDTLQV